jgi:hypothetical protein
MRAIRTESLASTAIPLRETRLHDAITQHFTGSQGLYRVTNVSKTKIYNPAQWKEMCDSSKYAGPDFSEDARGERSERSTVGTAWTAGRRGDKERKAKLESEEASKNTVVREESQGESGGDVSEKKIEEGSTTSSPSASPTKSDSIQPVPVSPTTSTSTTTSTVKPVATSIGELKSPALPKKRTSPLQRAEPTDAEWEKFIASFEDLPHGIKKEDYTIELMREVERRYWRTLTFGEAPMYGADMAGSLFDPSMTTWNVAKLGDLLPRLMPANCQIPGVVSPYLYFGQWRATFAWHVEDADLYSINYIHFGAPKFWYSVPQESSEKFERVMEGTFGPIFEIPESIPSVLHSSV